MKGRYGLAVLMLGLMTGLPSVATAGSVWVSGALGSYEVKVDSLSTLRFRSVVQQKYDYSCGSAALATLLSYHYGRPTTENETFDSMYRTGDQEMIHSQGFSMLDMKRYLSEKQAFSSDGFRLSLDELKELGVPAITMIGIQGYRHFVVIKGLKDGQVLVGDPALGLRSYSEREFQELRVNDILFIIRDRLDLARRNFNASNTWNAVTRAPVDTSVSREGLSSFLLNLPRANQW